MRVLVIFFLLIAGCAVQSEYSFVVSPRSTLPAGTDELISHPALERVARVAKQIAQELDAGCRKQGAPALAPPEPIVFETVARDEVNAFYRDGRIRLTRGMVDYLRHDAEIAFVIAHELAHGILKHPHRAGLTRRSKEVEADRFAIELVRASGFDLRAAVGVLERLARDQPQHHLGTDYPSYAERFARLQDVHDRNSARRFRLCSSTSGVDLR